MIVSNLDPGSYPTVEDRRRLRAERKQRVVALWSRPGRKTQRQMAAWLRVSQAHVSVLLREAGLRVGTGRNTLRRGSRPKGARYAAARARLDGALAALQAKGSLAHGDIECVAVECGVSPSSLWCRWKRAKKGGSA